MAGHSIILKRDAYDPAHAPSDLLELNESIIAFQKTRPDTWSLPLDADRAARREGKGVFPATEPDPDARVLSLAGRGGHEIGVRVIRPRDREPAGTYLHIHGGGWVFGEPVESDARLRSLAEATGLAVASVDYRLAPEHPFPCAPDDCEDVAGALADGRLDGLPSGFLAIGGESAGAHLAVLTLLRLRESGRLPPFKAANLVAGCYDLSLTPSVRNFGPERLVLNTDDIKEFVLRFVPDEIGLKDPAVSPIQADLAGLPPALFSVGTRDLLLDDTVFMANRWLSAGNATTLSLWNGGCHVFQAFDTASSRLANQEAEQFLVEILKGRA